MFLGVLLLAIVVAIVVYATKSHGSASRGQPAGVPPVAETDAEAATTGGGPMDATLDRWVGAGLVTAEQRDAILTYEQALATAPPPPAPAPARPARTRRIPAVAEALGYLGGMLAVIGLLLVVAQYWPDMATASRLLLSGVATVALLAAGFASPEATDPAWARLRWFLWLAGTVTAALFAGVLTLDGLEVADETVALACAGTVTMLSLVLWRGHERPVQQLTTLAGAVVAVGTFFAVVSTTGVAGVAVWLAGAALLAVGLRRVIPTTTVVTVLVGAVALLAGAALMVNPWPGVGLLLVVASGLGLLALAGVGDLAPEHAHRVVLVLVGGFALLQGVPSTLAYYGQHAAGVTGLVTWLLGALVLAAGARRLVRWPVPTELLGAVALLGGAALTGVQWAGFAPLFGIATAVGLVALGMLPGQVLLSLLGSVGLLINVPWAVGWYFPGEARAPLLIMVTGGLIIAIAVALTRMGGRFRSDLGSGRPAT